MKKRILSLFLVMAMLLSVVPMAGAAGEAAEPKFTGYNLFLQNSIAICFEANRAAIEEGFEKVEFYIGGELVQTRKTLPEADENGNVYFNCTKLTPAQMGEQVTAKLYIGGEIKHEFSASIKDYCMAVLNDAVTYHDPELRTMLVDLLNYGAATQTFAKTGTTLVNADLSAEFKALATTGDLKLNSDCEIYEYTDVTAPIVSWYGVGLNLKDSITLCYEFVADSIEKLAIHFFNDDYSLDTWVTEFEKVEGTENHYYAYFGMLNPTQLSETVSALAYIDHNSSNSQKASHKLMYSAESYAYAVANGNEYSAELKALTDAMMRYGDAVCRWNCVHTFTDGRCTVCEMEKVFGMTTDTITIQAEDAVLNIKTNNKAAVNKVPNTNATAGTLLSFNQRFSSAAENNVTYWYYSAGDVSVEEAAVKLTKKHEDGNIILYVTPSKSGTYSVQTTYATLGAARIGYLIEDESTTEDAYYEHHRIAAATESGVTFRTIKQFGTYEFGNAYQWVAGKTYAIRILATSNNVAYDQFTITHIHTYDDENDTTCNGCGEERCLHPHTVAYDDTHHWFDYSCDCGLTEEKVEHSYTKGVCECGKRLVVATTNGFAVIEAENAILNGSDYQIVTKADASNGVVVNAKSRSRAAATLTADSTGDIELTFKPDVAGTYYIWVRVTTNSASKGAGVWTDGAGYEYLAIGSTTGTDAYTWKKCQKTPTWEADKEYNVKLSIWSFGSTINFDQFVITTDANYTPTGIVTAG